MTTVTRRLIYFIFLCIPIRLALVAMAKKASSDKLKLMGYISMIPGLVMTYLWFTGGRQTSEMSGPAWWAPLRLVHGLLYLAFSASAISGNRNAWVWMALDVATGLGNWISNPDSSFNAKL